MIIDSYFFRTKEMNAWKICEYFLPNLCCHIFSAHFSFEFLFKWMSFISAHLCLCFVWIVNVPNNSLSLSLSLWRSRMAIILCVYLSGRMSFRKLKWIHRIEKFSSTLWEFYFICISFVLFLCVFGFYYTALFFRCF